MMIARRRLTFARSFTIGVIVLFLIIFVLLSDKYPLDVLLSCHNLIFQGTQTVVLKFLHGRSKPIASCGLYSLAAIQNQHAKEKTNSSPVSPVCRRVQPVPGSCDVAEKLFHTSPPASCYTYTRVEYCSITETGRGYVAQCSSKQCHFSLSGATVDIHTGRLLWRRFGSAQALEKWINNLLHGSSNKKHFGFCFVGCADDWIDFNGEEVDVKDDEDLAIVAVQLLLLPPESFPHLHNLEELQQHINFNLIFIDSVSRQHFFRSLPDTIRFFQTLSPDRESSNGIVLDFELVQAVRSRTFETLQTLFAGDIDPSVKPFGVLDKPPEALKTEYLLKVLKNKGYSTLWLEDLCYLWEWGISKDLLVLNKTFTWEQTWRKLQQALSKANIDSLGVTYAMCKILNDNGVPDHFHGPEAVCFNGRHQHDYLLDYLLQYQNAKSRAGIPFFTFMETNVGHEDTGRRIQTLDKSLRHYLEQITLQQNTLTIVLSDHGNSYGEFLGKSLEGRIELFHPHLFMLIPAKVRHFLGPRAMEALQLNQHRLISHLDLHYMLQSLAQNFNNTVFKKHVGYNVTSKGLLDIVSASRSCHHIPRIMPNLCICEDFDVEAESDDYHALFAHFAVATINNEIQQQFHQQAVESSKQLMGFGRCQRLQLASFRNVRKSFLKDTVSIKMDLLVPHGQVAAADGDPDQDFPEFLNSSSNPVDQEIFFVAIHVHLDSIGGIVMETIDRITPYSKFSACMDPTVKLQLCICDVNGSKQSEVNTKPSFGKDDSMFLQTDTFVAEHTENCLVLIVKKNKHGGIFSVVNQCQGKVFQVLFELKTSEMVVSHTMPRQESVFPGQDLFLCLAVKNAPKADWHWSFTLYQNQESL